MSVTACNLFMTALCILTSGVLLYGVVDNRLKVTSHFWSRLTHSMQVSHPLYSPIYCIKIIVCSSLVSTLFWVISVQSHAVENKQNPCPLTTLHLTLSEVKTATANNVRKINNTGLQNKKNFSHEIFLLNYMF